jgi:hypothetical protein
MEFLSYDIESVTIGETILEPIERKDSHFMINFTMKFNIIRSQINEMGLKIHTIRVSDKLKILLYHSSNGYENGFDRYGGSSGPWIKPIILSNVIYLYDEEDRIIGHIKIKSN